MYVYMFMFIYAYVLFSGANSWPNHGQPMMGQAGLGQDETGRAGKECNHWDGMRRDGPRSDKNLYHYLNLIGEKLGLCKDH